MPVPSDSNIQLAKSYRGRLAPTPTGDMHLGHARTFVAAWRRAVDAGGEVVLREDERCGARRAGGRSVGRSESLRLRRGRARAPRRGDPPQAPC